MGVEFVGKIIGVVEDVTVIQLTGSSVIYLKDGEYYANYPGTPREDKLPNIKVKLESNCKCKNCKCKNK